MVETPPDFTALDFEADGAMLAPGALDTATLGALRTALAGAEAARPGRRLADAAGLDAILSVGGAIGAIAASAIGNAARPVRAVLFDKTASTNWKLGWHQDRTIVVERRVEVAGFGPWTRKAGLQHVAPPFEVLTRMVTLRAHLDDVAADNAPLLIAPGSHRLGRIAEGEVAAAVARCGTIACLARAGDVWMYSTPILHASDAAEAPAQRRVLQLDYAAFDLPSGLSWRGV